MAISEAEPAGYSVEENAKLLDDIVIARLQELMRDPDGSVPVELVESYLKIVEVAYQTEITVLRELLIASNRPNNPDERFTIIEEERITRLLKDPTLNKAALIGHVARLRSVVLEEAATN